MVQSGKRPVVRRSYETWTVRSYARPQTDWTGDGERIQTGANEHVVVVFDPRGWTWEVILTQDRTAVEWLSISGHVDQKALRTVPLSYLVEVAADQLRKIDAERKAGSPLWQAVELASTDPGEFAKRGDPPTAEQFAAMWRSTPESTFKDGKRITRRRALEEHYKYSVFAIDKWTRKARDAGLLPDANPRTGKERNQR